MQLYSYFTVIFASLFLLVGLIRVPDKLAKMRTQPLPVIVVLGFVLVFILANFEVQFYIQSHLLQIGLPIVPILHLASGALAIHYCFIRIMQSGSFGYLVPARLPKVLLLLFMCFTLINLLAYPKISLLQLQTINVLFLVVTASVASLAVIPMHKHLVNQQFSNIEQAMLDVTIVMLAFGEISVFLWVIDAIQRLTTDIGDFYTPLFVVGHLMYTVLLLGTIFLSLPYRIVILAVYPRKMIVYRSLKKLHSVLLSKLPEGSVYQYPHDAPRWMTYNKLELEIYRLFVSILDIHTRLKDIDRHIYSQIRDIEALHLPVSETSYLLSNVIAESA